MENKFIRALRIREKIMTKKLYAAICLLLVATLFISSASYAWFALSTAPEATGINTTLGSNGNLEIALNTNDLSATELNGGENIPAGLETFYEKNPYWGNLIDLSDEKYGLQEIELKPSILNFADDAQQILDRESPIRFARYDADGRVVSVNASSAVATYNGETGDFTGNANYGVRAAGEKYPAVALTAGRTENSVRNAYAFCIDLLFRTNVTNANLLLQIEGIDRIYTEENAPDGWEYNEGVKGNGSNITVGNEMLQEALRVVFTDTLTGEVYATAAADSEGNLYLLDDPNSVVIKPLVQNQVSAISVWIYLDGSLVENLHADTAAATDLKINLQFATDVELNPAFGNGSTTPSNPVMPEPTIPLEQAEYYVECDGDDSYVIYSLSDDGSRDYELTFTGSMDDNDRSVVVEKIATYPNDGITIPALVVNAADNAWYFVSINPGAPFVYITAENININFVAIEDFKVGLTGTDLSTLFLTSNLRACSSLDLSGLDTSMATDMSEMFFLFDNLKELNLDGLDTSNVTTMASMFYNCSGLAELDVSSFNTSNVTSMDSMFYGCSGLSTLDISSFDTSAVKDMEGMLAFCSGLTELNISGFDTSSVTNMGSMFYRCSNLMELDVSHFDTSGVMFMDCVFTGCSALTEIDVTNFVTSNVIDMSGMFSGCSRLTELNVSAFDTSNVTSMRHMFYNCTSLMGLDVSGFNTSQVTDMGYMFSGCFMLKELDVSGFITSQVTDMGRMFNCCYSVKELDVSGFDTSKVTDMGLMFNGCESVKKLNVRGFNTSQVTDMGSMFGDCYGLAELDVSGFNTSQVTNMAGMFSYCYSLTELDVSGFNTSRVTRMGSMFLCCAGLTELDVSGFDTSRVTSMGSMFYGCSRLTELNVSNFNTASVTDMRGMFQDCASLTMLDLSEWDMSNVTDAENMFDNCPAEVAYPVN